MLFGLREFGTMVLPFWEDTGLFITGVLERSKLISELLLLPLLQEPSVSLLRLIIVPVSQQSLALFRVCNCKKHHTVKNRKIKFSVYV